MSLLSRLFAAAPMILLFFLTLVTANHEARRHLQHQHHHHHRSPGSSLHPQDGAWSNNGTNTTLPGFHNFTTDAACSFWMEDIPHQGVAPFQNQASYQVFRNVKDYGAKGDGVTDDTAAINAAITAGGNRCAPGSCQSSTTTPAVVYFPAGTYVISGDIIDYYYTTLYGNPNCLPTLKVAANYQGRFIIEGDPYQSNGVKAYGATNVFWRQIRNLIIDTTSVPASTNAVGIHWPTGQATTISNVVFNLNAQPGTQHWGLFIEEGSGGLLTDLVFYGGLFGANIGNQQFTSRNWTFHNCVTAINQLWDWGWTYQQISFNNVQVGLNMSSGGSGAQNVGSIVMFDSEFNNVGTGIVHARGPGAQPPAAGTIVLENINFNNVQTAIMGPTGTDLAGGSFNLAGWAQGHAYNPNSASYTDLHGNITPNSRSASLLSGGKYYTRPKPQYGDVPASQFLSVRSAGARGDGSTDDTNALQNAINTAAASGKILYIDGGDYIVTSTLYVPAGSRIVGEVFPVILATGSAFGDINHPVPVVQVGKTGESGLVEWSDCILSTKGANPGAVLVEWNLASSAPGSASAKHKGNQRDATSGPSGMWDVHTRIGGFAGSQQTISDCPAAASQVNPIPPGQVNANCIAAAASMHVTSSASNLYMEGCWLWVADHDAEDPQLRQITVYAGRGLLIESKSAVWLVGTAVEHHQLYEYQFVKTSDIFMGHIQTETAYYQPNPPAQIPFPAISSLSDPKFPDYCTNGSSFLDPNHILQPNELHNDCDGWALRMVDASNMFVYGAGHYSFFYNYNVTCSQQGFGAECQSRIVSLEKSENNVNIYGLSTVGTQNMITYDGKDFAPAQDNIAGFTDTIALFRTS